MYSFICIFDAYRHASYPLGAVFPRLYFPVFFVIFLQPSVCKIILLHSGVSLSANALPYAAKMIKPASTVDVSIAVANVRTARHRRIFRVPDK